ncbi:unnamed protein product [Adineta ricciae]|uniref:Uncharacterized protein n=1 Tax=Adineta ricciae TaxID=249248 RepID=A0A814BQ00_ADIRI|nr:unnamed protein product [Adineta ricciae]CAF0929187.1 unnamed protein product [Adineta ricciae]
MFLNDLSIYSIPLIGILILLISISSSKTIHLFTYQLSSKSKKQLNATQSTTQTPNSHVAIPVSSHPQLDSVDCRSRPITLTLNDDDDDEDLIQSDISSISVTNFCDNSSIELRLDQDLGDDDEDNDL